MTTEQRLSMVGAFPPPMHGMAAVNAAVRDRLQAAGFELQVMDIAASNLQRGLLARLSRLPRIFRALTSLTFGRGRRGQTLYMSVSGGFGQVYELLFAAVGRMRGMRLYLHHHSYAYLDCRSRIAKALMAMAGGDALHVVLSPGMACRLQTQYPQVRRAVAVSNAALLLGGVNKVPKIRGQLNTIGFLSNLAAEKGVFTFLDLCSALQARGLGLRCLLAGPFQDAATEKAVRQRLTGLRNVEYLGSLYGVEKARFYAGIDALLFPTQYVNEAEPLVIHEAMAAGVPVISNARGSIAEVVNRSCGLVVALNGDFVADAQTQIDAWLREPEALMGASHAAAVRFASLRKASTIKWVDLEAQMTSI